MRYLTVVGLLVCGTLTCIAARAQEAGPVAAWTFNDNIQGLVRDVARGTHHLTASGLLQLVDAPGAKAAVFDGATTFLRARNHPDLMMSDRVTVDVWLMVDTTQPPEPGCVVDKGGECYRIQLDGAAMFGLKGGGQRLDLSGGKLEPGRWHRVTGVFDRPQARLYLDGEPVGERQWDNEIGAGGDLFIGAKSGTTYFFRGKVDEIRIYNYPRPPRPEDQPSTELLAVGGVREQEARMDVTRTPGGVRVDTGAAVFELTEAGGIRAITRHGQTLVVDNQAPLLAASLFESADYDGYRDYAPGHVIAGRWRAGTHEFRNDENSFVATWQGSVEFEGGDALLCELSATARRGSSILTITTALQPQGRFVNRFLRTAEIRLPVALDKRKRVVQGGDRGVQWETRTQYEFHANTLMKLMTEPEHNIWRYFAVDQNSPGDYHIWKAESTCTAPLTMQRGLRAPGWMGVYDQRVGLVFAYRDFAQRSPKSLRVDAHIPIDAEQGTWARVCLWHEGLPALALDSPQAAAVFGAAHTTDWVVFDEEPQLARPDLALAQLWGVEGLASDPPARNEPPLADLDVLTAPAADDAAPLISGGVPFPRGALTDPGNVRLRRNGVDIPLQTKVTGWWPDHSIKWLLLTFPADGGAVQGASGAGDALTFALTRRNADSQQYRLDFGGSARPGIPAQALRAVQNADTVSIDTGPLQLQVTKGPQWLSQVKLNGRDLLTGGVRSFVDFLRTDNSYVTQSTHGQGTLDDGTFVPASIELEEAGPLRATVRLEGYTNSQEPTRLIVRIQAYAGRSVVRVFQSAEFLHSDVRVAYVRRMGLELPVAGMPTATVTAGGQDGPVALGAGVRAGLTQHSHLGYRAWHQAEGEHFLREDEVKHRAQGWLDVTGADGGVTVMLRDMWQQFPNELVADRRAGQLRALLWPESGPVMDVRRYSNYPHRSQGESAGSSSNWVETEYYGVAQFAGISKTHELLLYFHGPDVGAERIAAVNADFQRPPLVYCGPQWYLSTGVILPQPLPGQERFARMDANLNHYARFWIHHQKLWGWYGIWDYGDVQHYYKGGYGRIVPADKLVELLAGGLPTDETIDVTRANVLDYAPAQEWAFDNGRWGWTNTEGLPGLYMQNQYLRTGDREIYFFAEAMARHVRDVDMRHDGVWLGLGTRHGVQHWSDGNHEERQTTHSEFRYIYQLSGDMRSYDFARLLYQRIYSQRDVSVHAAHSGRLQGLLTWWEMTGSDETAATLQRYIPCFIVPEGICISPAVDFPEVKCLGQQRDINAANMFFWTFGAGHGLLEYYELTHDPQLRDALVKVAEVAIASGELGLLRNAVAFAAQYADNREPYLQALRTREGAASYLLQTVPHNAQFYGGPRGFLRGSVSGSLFAMCAAPYVMNALEGDPNLTEEQWQQYLRADREGGAPYATPPVLSWQSEYDIPELAEYLRIKHPQP